MHAAQQLLVLTLALEEALESDNTEEFESLIQAREKLLGTLPTGIPAPKLRQIQNIEDRMIQNARRRQIAIQTEVRKLLTQGRAEKAYTQKRPGTRFDLPAAG